MSKALITMVAKKQDMIVFDGERKRLPSMARFQEEHCLVRQGMKEGAAGRQKGKEMEESVAST